jgi:hypothetical protein
VRRKALTHLREWWMLPVDHDTTEMLSGVTLTILMVTNVEIHTGLVCPNPEMVSAELLRIGLDSSMGVSGDRATLSEGPMGSLVLELTDSTGVQLGARTFPRPFECAEVARAIALTVAIWESDVHPEFTPELAARQRPIPTEPARETFVPKEIAPKAPLPPVGEAPQLRTPLSHEFEVGFGVSVLQAPTALDLDARGLALGIGVIGIHRPRKWPLGLWLSGNVEEKRTTSLLMGSGEWRRTRATAGVLRSMRTGTSTIAVEGRAGVSVAMLSANGVGFATNYSVNTFDAGMEGALRLELRRVALSPWIDLNVVRWLTSYELLHSNPERGQMLPHWLIGLTVGFSFAWQ